jgi:hypothetical protein
MAGSGRREEIDAKIKAWELELERLRLALGAAPEPVHAAHYPGFVKLYLQKEVVKSRWEVIRGAYRPAPEATRRFEAALADMEAAWAAAGPLRAEVLSETPT